MYIGKAVQAIQLKVEPAHSICKSTHAVSINNLTWVSSYTRFVYCILAGNLGKGHVFMKPNVW
jgi:hypothetical protein